MVLAYRLGTINNKDNENVPVLISISLYLLVCKSSGLLIKGPPTVEEKTDKQHPGMAPITLGQEGVRAGRTENSFTT